MASTCHRRKHQLPGTALLSLKAFPPPTGAGWQSRTEGAEGCCRGCRCRVSQAQQGLVTSKRLPAAQEDFTLCNPPCSTTHPITQRRPLHPCPTATPGKRLSPTDPAQGKHLPPSLGDSAFQAWRESQAPLQYYEQDGHHPRCVTRPSSARLNPKAGSGAR